ncbi:hypothetical protein DFP72DRAFT_854925 [Ephemerocybe angulata]|uniref:Uncharacterized protein n=1 Tax=Ephemerocybe angulata TaxID=980116 RepID=A0A8H6M037_9AGAR|nr:hypothetical protein DFP72DRAFT_854925 [Tulosesus angulatus]
MSGDRQIRYPPGILISVVGTEGQQCLDAMNDGTWLYTQQDTQKNYIRGLWDWEHRDPDVNITDFNRPRCQTIGVLHAESANSVLCTSQVLKARYFLIELPKRFDWVMIGFPTTCGASSRTEQGLNRSVIDFDNLRCYGEVPRTYVWDKSATESTHEEQQQFNEERQPTRDSECMREQKVGSDRSELHVNNSCSCWFLGNELSV